MDMKPSRVAATVALAMLGSIMLIIHFNGGFMRGFGPGNVYTGGESIWRDVKSVILCLFLFFIPGLSLWMRSRTFLVIGAFMLAPVFIVGCLYLTMPPLALVILIPVLLWCYSARCRWKFLKAREAEQGGVVSSLMELSDVAGTPWEHDPDHTNSGKVDD